MEKYKVFEKLKKTRYCSYYNAQNLVSREIVTIKKLSRNDGWDELLNKKEIALMKQSNLPFLAKVKEIIKENGKFFVVHEQLTQCVEDLKKKRLSLEEIANIGKQALEIINNLAKEGVMLAEIRPQFFFVNRKRVKLVHIVSLPSDQDKRQIEEGEDYRYFAPEVMLSSRVINPLEANVFTIALIICELMLGRPLIIAKSKLDYMYVICGLFPKQRFDYSSNYANRTQPSETLQTFQQILEPVCQSQEFIELLCNMTKVNYKNRITLTDALQKLKELELKFKEQEQRKSKSVGKRGQSLNTKSILASIEKASDQITDERFRLSPINHPKKKKLKTEPVQEVEEKKEQVKVEEKKKIINTNHQIDLKLQNQVLERIGFMPQIAKQYLPLKSQKNIQDDASLSKITFKKTLPDFNEPAGLKKTIKHSLPAIKQHSSTSSPKPQRYSESTRKIFQTTVYKEDEQYKQIRLKTEQINIKNIASQTDTLDRTVKITNPGPKVPQLTNYARSSYNHFGIMLTAGQIDDEPEEY